MPKNLHTIQCQPDTVFHNKFAIKAVMWCYFYLSRLLTVKLSRCCRYRTKIKTNCKTSTQTTVHFQGICEYLVQCSDVFIIALTADCVFTAWHWQVAWDEHIQTLSVNNQHTTHTYIHVCLCSNTQARTTMYVSDICVCINIHRPTINTNAINVPTAALDIQCVHEKTAPLSMLKNFQN